MVFQIVATCTDRFLYTVMAQLDKEKRENNIKP